MFNVYVLFSLMRQHHNPHPLKSDGHILNVLSYIILGSEARLHTQRGSVGLPWGLRNSPCAWHHCPGQPADHQLGGKLSGEVWSLDNWAVILSHFSQKVSGETSLTKYSFSCSGFLPHIYTDIHLAKLLPELMHFIQGYSTSTTVLLTHNRVLIMNESIL